jgi:hypothetical protein
MTRRSATSLRAVMVRDLPSLEAWSKDYGCEDINPALGQPVTRAGVGQENILPPGSAGMDRHTVVP